MLGEPTRCKSYEDYELIQTLRMGKSAPMGDVFSLIEEYILHDEEIRCMGYTLAGLPFLPRHEEKLSLIHI